MPLVLELDRLTHDRQRVLVDILVVVVFVDLEPQRRNLGQELLHQPRLDKQTDAAQRVIGLHETHELAVDPLSADDPDALAQPLHRRNRLGIDVERQLGREPGGAQHPERIVAETHRGIGRSSQSLCEEILDSAGRIDELLRRNPQRHGVDSEVAAHEITFERVTEFDSRFAGNPVITVGPIGRDLDLLGPSTGKRDPRPDRAEIPPDVPVRRAQRRNNSQDVVGSRVRREVEIVRGSAQQRIAHRTADDREFEARFLERRRNCSDDGRGGEGAQARDTLSHVQHGTEPTGGGPWTPLRVTPLTFFVAVR